VPATGLGSQAYQREVLLTGRSSTGISVRSLLIRVAVRCGTNSRCHVAVRCQYRVSSVGRSARSLIIGLVRRRCGYRYGYYGYCYRYYGYYRSDIANIAVETGRRVQGVTGCPITAT